VRPQLRGRAALESRDIGERSFARGGAVGGADTRHASASSPKSFTPGPDMKRRQGRGVSGPSFDPPVPDIPFSTFCARMRAVHA